MDVARAPKRWRCPLPPCSRARPPASRFPGWASAQDARNQAQSAPKPGAALGRGGGKQLVVRQGRRGPWRSSFTASRGLLNAGCSERVYFGLSLLHPGWQPGLCCRGRSEPPPSTAGRGRGAQRCALSPITGEGFPGRGATRTRLNQDPTDPEASQEGPGPGKPTQAWRRFRSENKLLQAL